MTGDNRARRSNKFRSLARMTAIACVYVLMSVSFLHADSSANGVLPPGSKKLHRSRPINMKPIPVYLNSRVGPITATARQQTVTPSENMLTLDGDASIHVDDELLIYGDHLDCDLDMNELDSSGNVYVNELGTTFTANTLRYNAGMKIGDMENVFYRHYPYTLNAQHVLITPAQTEADNALITTSPPNVKPLILLKVDHLIIDHAHQRMSGRNASIYFGQTRVLTLRKFAYKTSSDAVTKASQNERHQIGYNSDEGMFASAGASTSVAKLPINASGVYSSTGKNQATLSTNYGFRPIPIRPPGDNEAPESGTSSADTVMYMIRDYCRVGKIPVPEGDPLRFHDFTSTSPMSNLFGGPLRYFVSGFLGNVAYDQRIYNASISNLYVTKWPEGTLWAAAPLGAARPDFPLGIDSAAVRSILSKPEFTIYCAATDGYYREKPTNVDSARSQYSAWLDSRPFLVANNLLCDTTFGYIDNRYSVTKTILSYPMAAVSLQRDFNDLSDLGMTLTIANTRGASPFSFDSLWATRELDLRGQWGNNLIVAGAVFQYNLQPYGLYTAKYSIGPNLHGVMPHITYDTRSRTTGFIMDVVGLTY